MMLRPLLLLALVAAGGKIATGSDSPEPKRGVSVAPITLRDDSGRSRALSEFAGYPLILLPIYTRCASACPQNVAQLEQALATSTADEREFRVLLFSFDADETSSSLANYRQREAIPLNWIIATADQADIDLLLESVGYRSAKAGREFMHPNLLLLLDPKLRIADWIYGTSYTAADLNSRLKVASGGYDWPRQHFQLLYSGLLLTTTLLCVTLIHQLRAPMSVRQIS